MYSILVAAVTIVFAVGELDAKVRCLGLSFWNKRRMIRNDMNLTP